MKFIYLFFESENEVCVVITWCNIRSIK